MIFKHGIYILLLSLSNSPVAQEQQTHEAQRMVAITIDDLPVASTVSLNRDDYLKLTQTLVSSISALGIPAYGFVVESKLPTQGVQNLETWLDAGLQLGNHTFSHPSLNAVGPDQFNADILAGEKVTRRLLAERGMDIRYFRFPMLHRGNTIATKNKVAEFLHQQGYTIAPVSIDNQEWVFARAYDQALAKGDSDMMRRIGLAYVEYMESVFAFFEAKSRELLNYEPKQILLIHANALNASYLDELADMLLERDYSFITLDEAMNDPFYSIPEAYTGGRGLSWLHRVALSQDRDIGSEPRDPEWLSDIYRQ